MKRYLPFIAAIYLLCFSCKKKETDPPQTQEPKDEFVYKDFSPDIHIQSIDTSIYITQPCAHSAPLPKDSSAVYQLDINSDNIPDFEFKVFHHLYTGTEYCGHCPAYEYYVTLKSLATQNGIALNSSQGVKFFKENETVNKDYTWANSVGLSIKSCKVTLPFNDGYLGIKIGERLGYINIRKVDNKNGIQILDFGFNKTAGRSIAPGQK